MGLHFQLALVFVGFSLGSACKGLQPGSKKSAPIFQAQNKAAKDDDKDDVDKDDLVKQEEPVQAKLAGYPEAKSPNVQIEISVSAVTEYKWKVVDAATECQVSSGFSPYAPVATPIKLDLADRKASPAIVAVCVLGKDASGREQTYPTIVSWVWAPEFPVVSDQIDLIDGNNEVKITPKVPAGNWLLIRSREPLTARPEDGKEYAVNQPLGNGTILVAGPMAEFIDKMVKNEESWTYTFVAYNPARRFSTPVSKNLTLAKQQLFWVPNNMIEAGQVPLESRAGSKRYVCRARHTEAGENRGTQPGSMFTANADLKAGNCFYEYGGVIYRTINYDLLMANKGNPTDMVRWVRGAANATSTSIPNGSIIAGTDDQGAIQGPPLFICLALNSQISGKASTQLPNGCHSYGGNNNGTPFINPNFDVLAFR